MKTYRFISLAAVCLLSAPVFFSCAKEDVPSPAEEKPGISVLFAEIDQQTKVYLGEKETQGYPLNWDALDRITVWNKTGGARGHYKLSQGAGTMCAQFDKASGDGVQEGPVYAFYPYDNTDASGSTIDFKIVRVQNYKAGSFGTAEYADGQQHGVMPMAASCDSATNMKLSPLMSVLKIWLKDGSGTPVSVSSIVVRNKNINNQLNNMSADVLNDSERGRYVQVDLTKCFGESSQFTWPEEYKKNYSDYVTLNCNPAVQLGSDSTSFYIVVPADTSSYTVFIHTTDGKLMKKSMKTRFRRNHVKPMATLQFQEYNYQSIDYIEKNADGTKEHNYGPGVRIGDLYWAPVNCGTGYEENIMYPHGLLYQWGRRYGHNPDSDMTSSVKEMTFDGGQAPDNAQYIGSGRQVGSCWVWYSNGTEVKDTLWNRNMQYPLKTPLKGIYDPCPDGWRIPTRDEAASLTKVAWVNIVGSNGISYQNPGDATILRFYPYKYHDHLGKEGSNDYLHIWTSYCDGTATYNYYCMDISQTEVKESYVHNTNSYAVRCVYDGLNQ